MFQYSRRVQLAVIKTELRRFFHELVKFIHKKQHVPIYVEYYRKKRKWKKLPPRNIRCWVVGSNQILQNHSKKLFHMKWLGKMKRCIVKWHEVCQELPSLKKFKCTINSQIFQKNPSNTTSKEQALEQSTQPYSFICQTTYFYKFYENLNYFFQKKTFGKAQ